MKHYLERLEVKGKKGVAIFSGLFFNEDNKLEFRYSNLPMFKNKRIIFDKEHESLLIIGFDKKVYIRLSPENVQALNLFEKEIRNELVSLYKDITTGKEQLLCLNTGYDKYPYLITTETILENGEYSPKYSMALEYAFSDKNLKNYNIGIYPNFKDYTDMQMKLGRAVENLKLSPNYSYGGTKVVKTTLKEILKGVA